MALAPGCALRLGFVGSEVKVPRRPVSNADRAAHVRAAAAPAANAGRLPPAPWLQRVLAWLALPRLRVPTNSTGGAVDDTDVDRHINPCSTCASWSKSEQAEMLPSLCYSDVGVVGAHGAEHDVRRAPRHFWPLLGRHSALCHDSQVGGAPAREHVLEMLRSTNLADRLQPPASFGQHGGESSGTGPCHPPGLLGPPVS